MATKKNKNTDVNNTEVEKEEDVHEDILETVLPEELKTITDLKAKAVALAAEAQKSLDVAKMADLEATNFTMQVFLKYKIDPTKDQLHQDGSIHRDVDVQKGV